MLNSGSLDAYRGNSTVNGSDAGMGWRGVEKLRRGESGLRDGFINLREYKESNKGELNSRGVDLNKKLEKILLIAQNQSGIFGKLIKGIWQKAVRIN